MFFGNVGSSSGISGIPVFTRITKLSQAEQIEAFKKRPEIQRKVDYFRANIGKIEKPDQFFNNPRLLEFALSSYGMESEARYPGRIRQVMMSDPADRNSVANRMVDNRYRVLTVDFDFVREGMANVKSEALVNQIVDGFLVNEYEKAAGSTNPNMTSALYFRRKIGELKRVGQLYGDPVLFSVVKDTLNISSSAVAGAGDRLTGMIERGFDVSRVGDQAYVDNFIKRYLALQDSKSQGGGSNALIGMFA